MSVGGLFPDLSVLNAGRRGRRHQHVEAQRPTLAHETKLAVQCSKKPGLPLAMTAAMLFRELGKPLVEALIPGVFKALWVENLQSQLGIPRFE